ncbi:cell division protein FtsK [Candidatus Marinamargulisbacteria bacterium SCGC AAA071-K20]|nr:cell division protein FtsK [Candidatus Marinamargulisbacteria bacterium SCGC AAA071-K20]
MAKKKRTRSLNRINSTHSQSMYRELLAIVFFLLSLFVLISNKFTTTTGILGYWLHQVLSQLVGYKGVSYLPLFLILPGFSLLTAKTRVRTILYSVSFCYICFIILLENIHTKGDPVSFQSASEIGGWIGVTGTYCLDQLVGHYGTFIFIAGVFILTSVLIFGLSIKELSNHFFQNISKKLQKSPGSKKLQTPKSKKTKSSKKPSLLKEKFLRALFFDRVMFEDSSNSTKNDDYSAEDELQEILEEVLPTPPIIELETAEEEVKENLVSEPEPEIQHLEIKQNPTPKASKTNNNSETEFKLPPSYLLKPSVKLQTNKDNHTKQKKEQAQILEQTLASFNVKATVVNITIGPSVTRYELQPGDGVKISKITALAQDIALKLATADIRIEAPIPGKCLVGIEVPNLAIDTITLRTIMDQTDFYDRSSKLVNVLGLTITGESILMDLGKMPHVLIAGATGSGKSVCINAIIISILMRATPEEVKFLMIDPKKVELSLYEGIPHLLAPVVTNPNKAAATLKKWALMEMERRYERFSKVGVKDIHGFNKLVEKQQKQETPDYEDALTKLPLIVVIIDELADLMMVASQDVEQTICRLAQMARATGIHLVIATQRPSVNVVTGLIKANVPSRVSFYLQSQIDSRTILDMGGAEKLLGKGDMLYSPVGAFKPKRIQGVFIAESEVKNIVSWLKKQGTPDYVDEILEVEPLGDTNDSKGSDNNGNDDLFEEARQLVMSSKYASTSYLQRKLKIGYNRAARIMDQLEESGVISEYAGEKKSRSVL